ncbi:MAG: hypothetical protein Q7S57_01905 [bacterium]|nr:hypothetical protein [bacterium]
MQKGITDKMHAKSENERKRGIGNFIADSGTDYCVGESHHGEIILEYLEILMFLNPNDQTPNPNNILNLKWPKRFWYFENWDFVGHWSLGFGI